MKLQLFLDDVTVPNQFRYHDITPSKFLEAVEHLYPNLVIRIHMLESSKLEQLFDDKVELTAWLNTEEQQELGILKLIKRKKEWLAGRICAKIATARWLKSSQFRQHNAIHIENREDGRPYISLSGQYDNQSLPDISISHSGDCAIALCSDSFCGIDIQETKDTLLRVKDRYCDKYENSIILDSLSLLGENQNFNLLWTAKESIRKAMSHSRLPGFLDLQLNQIAPGPNPETFILKFSFRSETIHVCSGIHRNYAISACLTGKK